MRRFYKGLWLLGMLIIGTLHASGASAATAACTTLTSGANQEITVGGVCRKVTNNTGRTICVPSANTTMWNSYISRTAANVVVEACGGPPPDCGAGPGSCSFTHTCETICVADGGFAIDNWVACRPRYQCSGGSMNFVNNTDPGCSAPPMCP